MPKISNLTRRVVPWAWAGVYNKFPQHPRTPLASFAKFIALRVMTPEVFKRIPKKLGGGGFTVFKVTGHELKELDAYVKQLDRPEEEIAEKILSKIFNPHQISIAIALLQRIYSNVDLDIADKVLDLLDAKIGRPKEYPKGVKDRVSKDLSQLSPRVRVVKIPWRPLAPNS